MRAALHLIDIIARHPMATSCPEVSAHVSIVSAV